MADKTESDIRRANEARQILDHDLIKEAFAVLQQRLADKWLESPEGDTAGRERLYRMSWSFRAFKAYFEAILEDGVMAEHKLAELIQQDRPQRSELAPENEHRADRDYLPGAPL